MSEPLTLSEVISGKILPATGVLQPSGKKEVVGTTTGELKVNELGTASYDIPVWVPEGVRGMKPELAIGYRSNDGIGLLGPKWGISGFSSISRCRKTLAIDGISRPLDFAGDTFCLDGERLIRISGNAGGPGEFRTRRNPFAKIVAVTAGGTGGLAFQVFHSDGRVSYYGTTDVSRLWGNPKRFPLGSGADPRGVLTYYVDKTQDRFGNSVQISYYNQPTTTSSSSVDELVPALVKWGAVGDSTLGQRFVQFQYNGFTGGHDFAHQRYVSGLGIYPGQRLSELRIFGPDGLGGVPPYPMKVYRFAYSAPTATGESLLSTISECDRNDVCKRPTRVTWEAGSSQYDAGVALTGITDIQGVAAPANMYRRIMVSDLNNDGRDDIVYRTQRCYAWMTRLAQPGGTFGDPIELDIGYLHTTCGDQHQPDASLPGDPEFTDLNGDGFPDIIVPDGNMMFFPQSPAQPKITTYQVFLNKAIPGNSVSFAPRISFEAPWDYKPGTCMGCPSSGMIQSENPGFAVGDLDGDLLPEIVRPKQPIYFAAGALWSANVQACTNPTGCGSLGAQVQPVVIPDLPGAGPVLPEISGFSALDLDGDGIAEILRDNVPQGTGAFVSYVTSPTMNGTLPACPSNPPQNKAYYGTPASARWALDLNGDGLKDFASVYMTDPGTIVTSINTGKGFAPDIRQTLPSFPDPLTGNSMLSAIGPAWRSGLESGVRVIDYNQDGRDDLVLVDASGRSSQVLLLSDGTGQFKVTTNSIPTGDFADGWSPFTPEAGAHGYRTSVVLDYNGDGLPDFLQLEGGVVKLYTRQGRVPDVVTRLTEGMGRTLLIQYLPVTDSSVYTVDHEDCAEDPTHLACMTGGRLLVAAVTEKGDSRNSTEQYQYSTGIYDRGGLGFLGFRSITKNGPASESVRSGYGITFHDSLAGGYYYPYVGISTYAEAYVDTPQTGGNSRHRVISYKGLTITQLYNTGHFGRAYSVLAQSDQDDTYDCVPQPGRTDCTGSTPRLIGSVKNTYTFDNLYGNLKTRLTEYSDAGLPKFQSENLVNTYYPANEAQWLTGVLQKTQVTSTTLSPAQAVTRTVNFSQDLAPNANTGLLTGEIKYEDVEPSGDSTLRLRRIFGRDPRGRITSISEEDSPPVDGTPCGCSGQCNTSCSAACAGAGANTGACIASCMGGCISNCTAVCIETPTPEARTTEFAYEDEDGVYVTTTTDAMRNTTRVWRHPSLGLIVQEDNESGASATYTYDTFARPLTLKTLAGATVTATYDDTTAASFPGAYVTITNGRATSGSTLLRVDPFGNPLAELTTIDATRKLSRDTRYDPLGRVTRHVVSSINGTAATTLNTQTLTFDDMDRLLSDCRVTSSDGASHCATNSYDGRTTVSVNEAGRTVTSITDAVGRLSIQRVTLGTTTSDTKYTYGAFDQLVREEVLDDGSGWTDLVYDTLGRNISLNRRDTGIRRMGYNAFGDMTSAYKQDALGNAVETVTTTYDNLGRPFTVTSPGSGGAPGINRTFYWDQPAVPGPGAARGKLSDVIDNNNSTSVHFEYNAAGQVLLKRIVLFSPMGTGGTMETYTASKTYDTQGRVQTLTYPKVPTETSPFRVRYSYDSYLGTPSVIRDDTRSPSVQIWAATARDERGQPTSETLRFATTDITRVTSYFKQDGRLQSSSIGTTTSRSQLDYTYQADGLPNTFGMSGVGGSWTSTFGNDNLGRLTSWKPSSTAPTVSYTYDSDGNMLSRSWSGESVTYDRLTSSGNFVGRAVTTKRGTLPSQIDTYQSDAFGRVKETPAASISYSDDDRVSSITRKPGGQVDTLVYDGLGERVLTLYGGPQATAGSLVTFDDLFELKRDAAKTTAGTQGRCRVRAGSRLVGDVVRAGTNTRTATFYLEDDVHSVVAEVSSAGTVTPRQRRDPFGNLLTNAATPNLPSEPGAADPDGSSRLGFGSHSRDQGWGLVDMLARSYSPRLGRFISPDLVIADPFDRREYNPFAYVQNNPTAKFDPLGLSGGGSSSGASYGPPPGYGGGGGHGGGAGGAPGNGGCPAGRDGGPTDAPGGASGTPKGEQPTPGTPGSDSARDAAKESQAFGRHDCHCPPGAHGHQPNGALSTDPGNQWDYYDQGHGRNDPGARGSGAGSNDAPPGMSGAGGRPGGWSGGEGAKSDTSFNLPTILGNLGKLMDKPGAAGEEAGQAVEGWGKQHSNAYRRAAQMAKGARMARISGRVAKAGGFLNMFANFAKFSDAMQKGEMEAAADAQAAFFGDLASGLYGKGHPLVGAAIGEAVESLAGPTIKMNIDQAYKGGGPFWNPYTSGSGVQAPWFPGYQAGPVKR